LEPVIGYDRLQCIISRGSENLQKEMNFENIVCIKLHNVVSVPNYEATKVCRQNKSKGLSVRLRCLLLLTLRPMQALVKRRATLSTDMEEMKSKIDSCFRNTSRGFIQTHVTVSRHAKEVPWIMEIMALQAVLFADVFSSCSCRTALASHKFRLLYRARGKKWHR